jgi:G:T/U-mismatch repair DNA glycosylase
MLPPHFCSFEDQILLQYESGIIHVVDRAIASADEQSAEEMESDTRRVSSKVEGGM